MKKRIVALVSALTLVFAMSINAAAAGSITAEDTTKIEEAAGSVENFPADNAALEQSKDVAEKIIVADDSVEGLVVAPLKDAKAVVTLAQEAAKLDTDSVESVKVETVVNLSAAKAGNVTITMALASNEKAYAIHIKADGSVEKILGTVNGNKVTFAFGSFSPVAIVRVTEKAAAPATNNQPAYNPNWDPTSPSYIGNTNASAPAPGAVVAPVAPKTGDVVMMVSIMAVIFMAGAAVAVAMSKKRA